MDTSDNLHPPAAPDNAGRPPWLVLLRRLVIWGLFLLLLYLARDFFFTAFMTFMISYLTLALVDVGMKRLGRGQERPRLRLVLTVGVFVLAPLVLLGVGSVLAPRLVAQGQRFAGWMSRV